MTTMPMTLRERIISFIDLPPIASPPAVHVIARESEEGYTRALVRYATSGGDSVEAFLFEPVERAASGSVLVLHQHNSQWGIGKSEVAGLSGDPLQAFGPALARRGIRVLAPDAVGFESRCGVPGSDTSLAPVPTRTGSTREGWLQYYNQMTYRLVTDGLLMRTMLSDSMTAVSLLANHFSAQAAPVGVVGHSLGGLLALFLAALDTGVAFACSSGAVCSYRHKMAHGTGLEMSLVIPGFARHFDVDDLLRCIAPRRFLAISSDDDAFSADAAEMVRDARPAYEDLGCAECLEHRRFPGGHALDAERFDAVVGWIAARAQAVV